MNENNPFQNNINQTQESTDKIKKDTSTVLYIVIVLLIITSAILGIMFFEKNKENKDLNNQIEILEQEKKDLEYENEELNEEQKNLESKLEELQAEKEEDKETEYDVSMFKSITSNDFINMFNEKNKTYFVYTGRSSCGFCVKFLPVLQQSIKDYDYSVYYLDVLTVDDSAYKTITNIDAKLEENFGYTPMVFAIRDGKVIDVNEGYTEYSVYKKFLEQNNVHLK